MTLDGVAFPWIQLICSLELLLDLWLLIQGAGDSCGLGSLYKSLSWILISRFLDFEGLFTVLHVLVISWLNYYNMYMGCPCRPLGNYNCYVRQHTHFWNFCILPVLALVSSCFQVQFKMLVITFKALHWIVKFFIDGFSLGVGHTVWAGSRPFPFSIAIWLDLRDGFSSWLPLPFKMAFPLAFWAITIPAFHRVVKT